MKLYKKFTPLLIAIILCCGCQMSVPPSTTTILSDYVFNYEDLPEYTGKPYVTVNSNVPCFSEEVISDVSYESYGELDELGRCTTAIACLSTDTMPAENEERGEIGNVQPSGWNNAKYDCVEGKYVQNRAHMIGWQLGAENANEKNLITGTRYMNIEMLEYENHVAEYIRTTGNHVMYRITPVFIGNELMCRGILMEGYSVEDEGAGISFCVFYYNVQPGIEFDYQTGESWYTGKILDWDSTAVNCDAFEATDDFTNQTTEADVSPLPEGGENITYVLNRNTMKFHLESCSGASNIKEENKELFEGNKEYLLSIGYEPCKQCNP